MDDPGKRARRFGLRAPHSGGGVGVEPERTVPAAEAGVERCTIAQAPDRARVHLSGTLSTVTLQPRGGNPALQATLDDGTGSLMLVWLGRRTIRGIAAGRSVSVIGRIGIQGGVRVMYNPRYELRPS